jgi:hypothetical protein
MRSGSPLLVTHWCAAAGNGLCARTWSGHNEIHKTSWKVKQVADALKRHGRQANGSALTLLRRAKGHGLTSECVMVDIPVVRASFNRQKVRVAAQGLHADQLLNEEWANPVFDRTPFEWFDTEAQPACRLKDTHMIDAALVLPPHVLANAVSAPPNASLMEVSAARSSPLRGHLLPESLRCAACTRESPYHCHHEVLRAFFSVGMRR